MSRTSASDKYIEFAQALNESIDLERRMIEKQRVMKRFKKEISKDSNGEGCGIEFTGSAYKLLSEGLESITKNSDIVKDDVFKDDPELSLLNASNLKSFIITVMADAHKKGNFEERPSRNNDKNVEYKYTIEMKKWRDEKNLKLEIIVENGFIKAGFFNWY